MEAIELENLNDIELIEEQIGNLIEIINGLKLQQMFFNTSNFNEMYRPTYFEIKNIEHQYGKIINSKNNNLLSYGSYQKLSIGVPVNKDHKDIFDLFFKIKMVKECEKKGYQFTGIVNWDWTKFWSLIKTLVDLYKYEYLIDIDKLFSDDPKNFVMLSKNASIINKIQKMPEKSKDIPLKTWVLKLFNLTTTDEEITGILNNLNDNVFKIFKTKTLKKMNSFFNELEKKEKNFKTITGNFLLQLEYLSLLINFSRNKDVHKTEYKEFLELISDDDYLELLITVTIYIDKLNRKYNNEKL